jgi:hypothetical protein
MAGTQFSPPAHQLWIWSDRILESLCGLVGEWKFLGIGADPKLGYLPYGRSVVGGGNNAEDERRHAERDSPSVPDYGRLGLKARQHKPCNSQCKTARSRARMRLAAYPMLQSRED